MNAPVSSRWQGFWLAQGLGVCLLLMSYLRIAGDTQSMLFSDQVLDVLFAGPIWGTKLGYNLVWFGLALLLLHALFGAACWLMGRVSLQAWPSSRATLRQYILIWFLVFSIALLANNAASFVESSLGEPYAATMGIRIAGLALGRLLGLAAIAAALATLAVAAFRWWKAGNRPRRRAWASVGLAGLVWAGLTAHGFAPQVASPGNSKPNVILIGIDSMRADLLDPKLSPGVTPNIDAFTKSGVVFTDAITPLARTFPSMMSMLTGKHPHHSGAVMNLLPRELIHDSESLPRVLAKAGYHTAYMTDEVRFSNIDTSYGFDQVITPPIGASEFLIGKLADTPLSNLLVNTRVAGWLFPHVYANRGAADTYDPDVFVERIDRELRTAQPLFATVHLTLGHWPYTWGGAPIKARKPDARWPEYYLHAMERVDQQFADVLQLLNSRGLLRNAVVVVYSDHGEAFDSPNEALVPDGDPLVESLKIDPHWGHGTTVLTAHQYRIALGMQRFEEGKPVWRSDRSGVPVSFEDITPTVLDSLGLRPEIHFDGRSLLPVLAGRDGAEQSFAGRIRFTETEYQPQGIASQEGSVSASNFAQAISVYHIDRDTDRIQVKRNRLDSLLLDREYAAVGEHFLVGAFPSPIHPGHDYVAVSMQGGTPRQLFAEPTEPELQVLWRALHAEFGDVLEARRQSVAAKSVANR
jgi:arylsulfatase A-like enzyme